MARNVEIKARVFDPSALRRRAQAIAAAQPQVLVQRDTFYFVPKGRLKLREFAGGTAELIYYERPDGAGPKASAYFKSAVSDPASMRELMDRSFGTRGVVKKCREVFRVDTTRIHLDDVEGLGAFVELEVVLADRETEAQGEAVALRLMRQLGVQREHLVTAAYVDLLGTAVSSC